MRVFLFFPKKLRFGDPQKRPNIVYLAGHRERRAKTERRNAHQVARVSYICL